MKILHPYLGKIGYWMTLILWTSPLLLHAEAMKSSNFDKEIRVLFFIMITGAIAGFILLCSILGLFRQWLLIKESYDTSFFFKAFIGFIGWVAFVLIYISTAF